MATIRPKGRRPYGWATSWTLSKWLADVREVIQMAGLSPTLYEREKIHSIPQTYMYMFFVHSSIHEMVRINIQLQFDALTNIIVSINLLCFI